MKIYRVFDRDGFGASLHFIPSQQSAFYTQPAFYTQSAVCILYRLLFSCILTARKVWDFDFLRGLALGRLDGFLIEKYEKKRESFGHSPAKFESVAMRFSGKNHPGAGVVQKLVSTLVFL